jgi:hypothetical protein
MAMGWHGESKRHAEVARKNRIRNKPKIMTLPFKKSDFGSGGYEQYKLYMKHLSIAQAATFNSMIRIARYNGNELRGGDVEKIYWKEIMGKTDEEYGDYLRSLD